MNHTSFRHAACAVLAGWLGLASSGWTQGPSWWHNRGVVDTNQAPNDFALITQGQLKWMATNAFAEMQRLGGAGTNVEALIQTLSNSNNYCPVNLGQLKYVAQPFYDRLQDLDLSDLMPDGMAGPYPWSNRPETNDYALATIGQAKYAFSFDLLRDSDQDGLPDFWEVLHGLDPDAADRVAFDRAEDGVWWEQDGSYDATARLTPDSVRTALVWQVERLEGWQGSGTPECEDGVFQYYSGHRYRVSVQVADFPACSATCTVNIVWIEKLELISFPYFVRRYHEGGYDPRETLYPMENESGLASLQIGCDWLPTACTGLQWRLVNAGSNGPVTNWSLTTGPCQASTDITWTGGEVVTSRHFRVWIGWDANTNGVLDGPDEFKLSLNATPYRLTVTPLAFVPLGVTNEMVVKMDPPLPLSLELMRAQGASGAAEFGGGGFYREISGLCETVTVYGVEPSSQMSNMCLWTSVWPPNDGCAYEGSIFMFTVGEITNLTASFNEHTHPVPVSGCSAIPIPRGCGVDFTAQGLPTGLTDQIVWNGVGVSPSNATGAVYATVFTNVSASLRMGLPGADGSLGDGGYDLSFSCFELSSLSVSPGTIYTDDPWQDPVVTVETNPEGWETNVVLTGAINPFPHDPGYHEIQAVWNVIRTSGYEVVYRANDHTNHPEEPNVGLHVTIKEQNCAEVVLEASYDGEVVNATWGIVGPNPGIRLTVLGSYAILGGGEGTVTVSAQYSNQTVNTPVSLGRQDCGAGGCGWGAVNTRLQSLDMAVNLGAVGDGSAAGLWTPA